MTPDFHMPLAALLLGWGLLDCFLGYRVFRFSVAVSGALAAGWGLGALAEGLFDGRYFLFWPGFVVGALLGAWLSFAVYRVGVFLLGFMVQLRSERTSRS